MRVLAQNPSPFTYTGTGTYVVGSDRLIIIDPGPDLDDHLPALISAIDGRALDAILVTHSHLDHSPLSRRLQDATDAPIMGFGPHGSGRAGGLEDETVEAGADKAFAPDKCLADGETISVPGCDLMALHTPGHTSNHLCFLDTQTGTLFTGDHIMGWSTTVISPPDGDMAQYLASLERLQAMDIKTLVPTHGPIRTDATAFIDDLIQHRRERENQILRQLKDGVETIDAMVPSMYKAVDPWLHPAAARSVFAHLIALYDAKVVDAHPALTLDASFRLR